MRLQFMSEEGLQDLRLNYDLHRKAYHKKNYTWFDEFFNQKGRLIESNIEFEMPKLNFSENFAVSDKENVKLVYRALKNLTISQATQEKLWAGLVHLQFREYAFNRLSNELSEENDKRINTALFFKNGTKRSLFVHILARLWWVGYMTYDENNKENPFWLTDFFCEKDFSARSVVFFSSNFTSNRNITIGILRAIYKLNEQGHNITRDFFVQANKYLNVIGGAMVLDMLSTEEVEELIMAHLIKVLKLEDKQLQQVF
ncbi:DUF6339 family protein [Bacillus sp. UNCCL81]|uniref:DUF6339 family protein n=1 Tax=Bacillus sp. UNCCL81 TaxID=1502755 RepID=UPI0008EF5178|nr:DUF6339 family protein [Bacillus sp. UNCCL81]SFC95052.1 hypothetical protein SAMN02799633_02109 [Bacillus sp. UNCCL81]